MNSIRPPWTAILIVALIAILGGVLRCIISGGELLWLDELHTSWAVNGSIGDVAGRAADGNQPPLYFWLTWISVFLCGDSELSIRTVSILAGIGTLLLSAWLTWRWTASTIAACVVTWLIAVDEQFLYYGTEARPYALLQLLSVVQVIVFWRACFGSEEIAQETAKGQNATRIGMNRFAPHWALAIVSTLILYTHFTSIWIFVAELVFLATWLLFGGAASRTKTRSVSRLLGTAIVVGIASIPAFIQLLSVFQKRENWEVISSVEQLWSEIWIPLALMIVLPVIYLPIVFLVENLFKTKSAEPLDANRTEFNNANLFPWKLVFVLLWALVPIGCVATLAFFGLAPMALQRYTLVGLIGLPVFAGLIIGCLSTKPAQLGLAVLVIATCGLQNPFIKASLRNHQLCELRFEDWSSPIAELNSNETKQSHPVFLFANVIEDSRAFTNDNARFQDYLRFPVRGLYEVKDNARNVIAGPTLAFTHFKDKHVHEIAESGGAWILVRSRPDLVGEIGNEIRQKTAAIIGKKTTAINVSVRETPGSPVYLLSVDW